MPLLKGIHAFKGLEIDNLGHSFNCTQTRVVVVKKNVVLIISVLLLTACSAYTSNGEKQYLQSKNGATVVVPPPLTDSNISHFYDLPQQNQSAQVSIAPPSDPNLKQAAN